MCVSCKSSSTLSSRAVLVLKATHDMRRIFVFLAHTMLYVVLPVMPLVTIRQRAVLLEMSIIILLDFLTNMCPFFS